MSAQTARGQGQRLGLPQHRLQRTSAGDPYVIIISRNGIEVCRMLDFHLYRKKCNVYGLFIYIISIQVTI